MTKFKKISLITAVFTLILGLSINSTYAQERDEAPQPETYKLTGEVVDAESGEALPNATVTIVGKELEATSGEQGKFSFEELPAGTHTIKVEQDGYQTWEKKVTLTKDSKLTIELRPGM